MPAIKLNLTHNLLKDQTWMELRFDTDMTMEQVKNKVSSHTGSSPNMMILRRDGADGPILDNAPTLGSAGVEDGMTVHVVDQDPNSIVKVLNAPAPETATFKLSEEEYAKRPGNAREFMNQLKQKRPDLFNRGSKAQTKALDEPPFPLDSRCQIKDTTLRGRIAWIGQISDKMQHDYIKVATAPDRSNVYCGVIMDSPVGNFDGKDPETKAVLFECPSAGRGLLVHMDDLEVGDEFGEVDPFELDEI